ncbi:MAG: type II secretion system F family protein [Holophagales bacterium]|nr:type II secretion system F family protein [Holophagales bacterium]
MQFVCRYGTPDGRVLTEIQSGPDAAAVRRELERRNLHIFEVRPRSPLLQFELPFTGKRRRKIPAQDFLAFNQEMAALLRAGLPLLQALDLMLERMEDPVLRDVLTDVRDQVKSGAELSDAFASFGDLFPALYPATLKAGERSGELESVIRRFIRYQRLVLDARKRVVSALVYPAVLVGLSIAMLIVMAVYVVPMFADFYADLNAELPTITKITLGVSGWMRQNILWVLIGGFVAWVGFRRFTEGEAGQRLIDRYKLKLPLLGSIFRYFGLSELCRSLSTLIAGGIPLVSGLETATQGVSNRHIRSKVEPSVDDVRQGSSFYAALERTGVFPHMAIDMIKVGEATGSLDEMLSSVSDYFDEFVETRVQRLLSLVEPAMLIIMGLLISLLLISIYLPMFGALSQVGT